MAITLGKTIEGDGDGVRENEEGIRLGLVLLELLEGLFSKDSIAFMEKWPTILYYFVESFYEHEPKTQEQFVSFVIFVPLLVSHLCLETIG